MLADFVLQWRAGVFPVFVGQTIHAFNGAVYPLRVAPLYQHLAGILDLLTLHRLGFFALQHLLVIVCGAAGLFACYFALAAVAPARRWSAGLLAILYLSCPGIMAVVYTQDLYMTWTTIPFLPLACYGIVRAFQKDDWTSQVWLAAPLAALWWAHSPVAMWMTGIVALTQLVRLSLGRHSRSSAPGTFRRAAGGALFFAALAQYPIVSYATLHPPPVPAAPAAPKPPLDLIPANIRAAWPQAFLPLSANAGTLGDLQLGYGLALAGVLAAAGLRRNRNPWIPAVLLASAAGLAVLLVPMPGLNAWLWNQIPQGIRFITYYWPMQRFYPIMAALVVFACQSGWERETENLPAAPPQMPPSPRRGTKLALSLLAIAAAWSLWESRQFIRAGRTRTSSAADSIRALQPENLLLMNHSYGLFTALPPYFSNGEMDPAAETRLLSRNTLQPLPRPAATPVVWTPWRTKVDANPGILDLLPVLRLAPGCRYELRLDFAAPNAQGVLELIGRKFYRQYLLPQSGQPEAFGSRPGNPHRLILWSTDPTGEEIALRFIPTSLGDSPPNYRDFGGFAFRKIEPGDQPVAITSLLPFRASVEAPSAAWVETPRMFLGGYVATSDGRRAQVRPSPAGLAMVAVARGTSHIELRYDAPGYLLLSYFAALAAWIVLGTASAAAAFGVSRKHAAG
ncbi:MAG TPA: hypothetical protein VHC86_06550 [Opitutaceae bacterium]|nr:hypothetical protein [Opitutaceae bacterium]